MIRFVAICSLAIAFIAEANAQRVWTQNGNACVSNGGESKTLTTSGRDSEPVLSPDGKWIVFVRTIPSKKISTGLGDADATELWQIRADGKEPIVLVRPKDSGKMENVLAGFSKPQFSTNGRLVYFLSEAWATSGALHVVDTTNKGTFCLSGARVRSGSFRRVSRLSFGRAASLFHRRRQLQLVLAAAARRQGRGAGWRRHGKFQSNLPQGLT